jgi:serine/threonine-protein kinase
MAGPGRLLRFASLAPVYALLLQAAPAAAQNDKAAAEALFDQGVRLMKQNSFSDACPKLEESERIDPAVGTLLYLAECYERVGKTASAWATFREAASLANNSGQGDRARIAGGRAQDLEGKLSRLSIELAPDVSRIPGVVVKRSGQRLESSLYGTPLPVDPGEYRIEVSAPGYETWAAPIKVEPGGASASVRVPALVKGAEAPVTATTGAQPPVGAETRPPPQPSHPPAKRGLTTGQTVGLVVGGVGVIGLGLGSYFGVRAISKNSDAEEQCNEDNRCNQEGIDLTDKARKDATAANIAFAAGGVLVALGGVVFLSTGARDEDRVALVPLLGPGTAAASISGRF